MLGDDIAIHGGSSHSPNAEVLLLAGLVVGLVTLYGSVGILGIGNAARVQFFHPQRSHRQSMMGIAAWGCVRHGCRRVLDRRKWGVALAIEWFWRCLGHLSCYLCCGNEHMIGHEIETYQCQCWLPRKSTACHHEGMVLGCGGCPHCFWGQWVRKINLVPIGVGVDAIATWSSSFGGGQSRDLQFPA